MSNYTVALILAIVGLIVCVFGLVVSVIDLYKITHKDENDKSLPR